MKTTVAITLAICFSIAIGLLWAQPFKQNPAPFNQSMSAYTQTHVQDTMFNKHPLLLNYLALPDTTGQTAKSLSVKAGGGFYWK